MNAIDALTKQRSELVKRLGETDPCSEEYEILVARIDQLTNSIDAIVKTNCTIDESSAKVKECEAAQEEHKARTAAIPDDTKARKQGAIIAVIGTVATGAAAAVATIIAARIRAKGDLAAVRACGEETSKGGFMHNDRMKTLQITRK